MRVRRWLALHRRPVSAALAFGSVLFALSALSSPDAESSSVAVRSGANPTIEEGQLEVPVRLSDAAVADLLSPGDVVDVLGADSRGPASVVADQLLVTAVPDAGSGSGWSSDGDGLVVVAATPEDALALAGAASRGQLTVAVHP